MKVQNKKQEQKKQYDESTINGLTMRVYESGFASLSIDVNGGTLVINGKIRFTKDGAPFFAFPSYKGTDGKYYNHVYTLDDGEGESALKDTITALVSSLVESGK
jgi:hypothetical protein